MHTYYITYKGNDGFEYELGTKAKDFAEAYTVATVSLESIQRRTIEIVEITEIVKDE